jgi:hypothetical protein
MTDVKTLLTGPLLRAGIPNAEIIATEQLALLRGHHLLADDTSRRGRTAKTTERRLCGGDCLAVELVGGVCPICGWRPD